VYNVTGAVIFEVRLMSDSTENLEKVQKNQKHVGAVESDPETTGPAENLREEAAEAVDKDETLQNLPNFSISSAYKYQ
jgi:hypothetical protein